MGLEVEGKSWEAEKAGSDRKEREEYTKWRCGVGGGLGLLCHVCCAVEPLCGLGKQTFIRDGL